MFLFSLCFIKNFSIEIKNDAKTVYFHQRHFAVHLKENKIFFVKKKIVDSEFVKICHEQVIHTFLLIFYGRHT